MMYTAMSGNGRKPVLLKKMMIAIAISRAEAHGAAALTP